MVALPHQDSSEPHEDDPDHAVPSVRNVDVQCIKEGGGSDLYLVVASALGGNERDLERLLQKLENYLVFLQSSQCVSKAGLASPENTRVVVAVHPESNPLVYELLRRNAGWVANNGATLGIEPLSDQALH